MDEIETAIMGILGNNPKGMSTTAILEELTKTDTRLPTNNRQAKVSQKLGSLRAYGFIDRSKQRVCTGFHKYAYLWRVHRDDPPRVWMADLLPYRNETPEENQQRVQKLLTEQEEERKWAKQR